MTTASLTYPRHNYLCPPQTGASETAGQLTAVIRKALDHFRAPVTSTPPATTLEDEIINLYYERCEDNWDDQGAIALNPEALIECLGFLELYPSDLPLPEPVPEPDGAIALEWYVSPSRIFTISLTGEQRIAFAGKLGNGNRIHGIEEFNGELSPFILESIRRISA